MTICRGLSPMGHGEEVYRRVGQDFPPAAVRPEGSGPHVLSGRDIGAMGA